VDALANGPAETGCPLLMRRGRHRPKCAVTTRPCRKRNRASELKQNSQPANGLAVEDFDLEKRALWLALDDKANAILGAASVDFRLAPRLLRRRLVRAQAAHLVKNAFGVEFALQPFKRSIDRFAFADDDFWHLRFIPSFLS
jgi:hypothetical protein